MSGERLSQEALERRDRMQELMATGRAETWSQAHYILLGRPQYPPRSGSKPLAAEEGRSREQIDRRSLLPNLFIVDHLE